LSLRQLLCRPLALAVALCGGCNLGVQDECDPRTYSRECTASGGGMTKCVRVERRDYLFGLGKPHYEIVTVTCPGGKPFCLHTPAGKPVCRAK
jgi:hypothetical protein